MFVALLPKLPFIFLILHIIANAIFFIIRITTENQEEEAKKKSTSTMLWIHSSLSLAVLLALFFTYRFAFLTAGDMFKDGIKMASGSKSENFLWTLSRILILIHIVVNVIIMVIHAAIPDSSVIVSWIYEIISTLVMITIAIFFKNKEILEKMNEKAKKMKDKVSGTTGTTGEEPGENQVEAAAAPGKDAEAFGKRQKRRNPPKKRKKKY